MKTCIKCKLEKEESDYQTRKTRKGEIVLKNQCRLCYNKYQSAYCRNNKKHIARVIRCQKVRIKKYQEKKCSTGCSICGYNKCARSLQYHHLNREDKEFNISCVVSRHGVSKEKFKKELEKCILLCANCHGEVEEGMTKIDQSN